MESTARKIRELEGKLNQHLAIKDSFLAGKDWKEKKADLETQLFNLKIKFFQMQIEALEQKKSFLIKEHEKRKSA